MPPATARSAASPGDERALASAFSTSKLISFVSSTPCKPTSSHLYLRRDRWSAPGFSASALSTSGAGRAVAEGLSHCGFRASTPDLSARSKLPPTPRQPKMSPDIAQRPGAGRQNRPWLRTSGMPGSALKRGDGVHVVLSAPTSSFRKVLSAFPYVLPAARSSTNPQKRSPKTIRRERSIILVGRTTGLGPAPGWLVPGEQRPRQWGAGTGSPSLFGIHKTL